MLKRQLSATVSGEFATIMKWADHRRALKIRTNADTPNDARQAVEFGAEGIGLCRTEHMFFAEDRIPAMREMIVSKNEDERRKALQQHSKHPYHEQQRQRVKSYHHEQSKYPLQHTYLRFFAEDRIPAMREMIVSKNEDERRKALSKLLPMQRADFIGATTAACEVIPPRAVKIPSAAYIPSISSGDVSSLTRTTFSPLFFLSTASSAEKATLPQAAPGDASWYGCLLCCWLPRTYC